MKHPPRGYVVREEWLRAWDRCDPGDAPRDVGVHFVPHVKDQSPLMFKVMSVAEHEELLAEAVAAAKADGARELANFIEDQCYTSGTFGENEMWRKVHEMETSRAKPEQGGGG